MNFVTLAATRFGEGRPFGAAIDGFHSCTEDPAMRCLLLLALTASLAGCAAPSQHTPDPERQPSRISVRWAPPGPQTMHITKSASDGRATPEVTDFDRASANWEAQRHFDELRERSGNAFGKSFASRGVALADSSAAEAELTIALADKIEAICTTKPCAVWLTADVSLHDRLTGKQAWSGRVRVLSAQAITSYDQATRQPSQVMSDPTLEFVDAVMGALQKARIVRPQS